MIRGIDCCWVCRRPWPETDQDQMFPVVDGPTSPVPDVCHECRARNLAEFNKTGVRSEASKIVDAAYEYYWFLANRENN